MGAIQDKLNSLTASVGVLGAGLSHGISQGKAAEVEKAKVEADIAATEETKTGATKNLRNDTIEAAEAIYAHSGDAGRTPGDFDPVVGGKK